MNAKLRAALESIKRYLEEKKPATFADANHMLAVISVIASETLAEEKAPAG
jgi:hypothetical protein